MAQIDLQTLNSIPRILSEASALDKNNEIIVVNATRSPIIIATTTTTVNDSTVLSSLTRIRSASEPNNNTNSYGIASGSGITHSNNTADSGNSNNNSNINIINVNSNNNASSQSNLITSERVKKCQFHCGGSVHRNYRSNTTSTYTTPSSSASNASQRKCCSNNSSCSSSSSNSSNIKDSATSQDIIDGSSTSSVAKPQQSSLINERYVLLDLVEGSTLFKCIDVRTNTEYVCKIAAKPCTNLLTAHFRLDGHSHVNQIEKVIDSSDKSYLLFNPSEGDLHSYVRVRKRLRENEARQLFQQMCNVVNACHQEGIILRDLKLRKFVFENSKNLHLKLETLEDAVVLNDPENDMLHDRRGCPAYVSPEILRAHTQYSGKAADMWSLGVILYTMLVGRYPFNDTEHTALFAKISRGQYVVPECLSAKARCIIRALLRRDPEERITSSDVLFHPWLRTDNSREPYRGGTSKDDQMVPIWKPTSQ